MDATYSAPAGQNTAFVPGAEPEAIVFEPPRTFPQPAFEINNIPVFLGCDNNFFPHAATTIASIMAHASPENNYDMFIVHDGIPEERMTMATRWLRQYPNASLRFVDIRGMVTAADKAHFPTTTAFSFAIYFRLYAPSVFIHYNKIVYLDSDMVALADVAELYQTDVAEWAVAACHDFVAEEQGRRNPRIREYWRRELGLEPGDAYFNSGCLVLNTAKMRSDNLESVIMEKMRRIQGTALPDQDALNAVLHHKTAFMKCEWNLLDWMADPDEASPSFSRINAEARELVRHARRHCRILHFTERKPWNLDYCGRFSGYYWTNAKRTPFFSESLAALNKQRSLWRLCSRYLVLSWQQINFAVRGVFARAEKQARYRERMTKLKMLKQNLLRHMYLRRDEVPEASGLDN